MSPSESRKIRTTDTAFDIIELLRREGPIGVTAIADRVDLTKSTVHGHLATLLERGYIVKENGKYALGLRFLDLGMSIRRSDPIFDEARQKMDRLADETGERTQLMVEQNGLGFYLYRAEGGKAVPTDSKIGKPRHLHACASGKALLSAMEDQRVRSIVDERGLPAKTANTITDESVLFEELRTIRDRGYSINRGESVTGLWAIGAPIRNVEHGTLAALSLSGPAHRLQDDNRFETEFPNKVRATVEEIELNLSYS